MSIKSYLRELMKLTPTQSAPKAESYISLSPTGGVDGYTYTAPADGYVSFSAQGNGGIMRLTVDGSIETMTRFYSGESNGSYFLRVNKGDNVKFSIENMTSIYWARFIRTVGGGARFLVYQVLKRRKGLCLRLSRSFGSSGGRAREVLCLPSLRTKFSLRRTQASTRPQATATLWPSAGLRLAARSGGTATTQRATANRDFALLWFTKARDPHASICPCERARRRHETATRAKSCTSFLWTQALDLSREEVRYGLA